MHLFTISTLCLCAFSAAVVAQTTRSMPIAMWTYVSAKDGIHLLKLDLATGGLTPVSMVSAASTNFLAIAPGGRFLYGVGRGIPGQGQTTDQIIAFAIDPQTGGLTLLNSQPSAGNGVCYVSVDPAGKNALVANYSSATIAVFPIAADGRLSTATCHLAQTGSSIDHDRQQHAFAHSINVDPTGHYAFVADLGADKLFSYRLDAAQGLLAANDPPSISTPPGSGPRHFTFDPTGKRLYLLTELHGTVIGYDYDSARGVLTPFQEASALPPDFKGRNTSAEIQFGPGGKFLYASNRDDSNFITIFAVDQMSGKLSVVNHQSTLGTKPRNFRIDPTGRFLIAANQGSDSLVVFRIDSDTGKLRAVAEPSPVPAPQCVKFAPVPVQ